MRPVIHPIRCSEPGHATRSASPDWSDLLGYSSHPLDGHVCSACARLAAPRTMIRPLTDDEINKVRTVIAERIR